MSRCTPSLLTLAVVMLASQFAWADEPAKEGKDDSAALFTQLDANSDGFVVLDEVAQDKQRLLRRLIGNADKDRDGKLSRDEFIAGLKAGSANTAAEPAAPDRPRRPGAPGEGPFDPDALFARMDQNGDGKVTADEVPEERRERVKQLIERLDANGDGAVSKEEFAKLRERLPGAAGRPNPPGQPTPGRTGEGDRPEAAAMALLKALDTDGDGKLSKEEITKAAESLATLDKNGDGAIEPAELARAGRPDRPAANRPGGRPDGSNPGQIIERLMAADRNGDGKISKEEAPERIQQFFDRLDGNGDGQLDAAEMRRMAERFRNGQGAGGDSSRRRPERKPPADKTSDASK